MMRIGLLMRTQMARNTSDSGQTTVFAILVLGLFLIAAVGFAIDYSNIFFRRQTAQAAADAACQAAVMDMLVIAQGNSVPGPGFTAGTNFECSAHPTAVPCQYANLNGYNGATGLVDNTPSVGVAVSFPSHCDDPPQPGCTPGLPMPPPVDVVGAIGAHPFVKVAVTDRQPLWFSRLLSSAVTQDVSASATCAVVQSTAPIPIIVLNPTCPHSFEVSGSATLKVVGGPTRSVQVNSDNSDCAAATNQSSKQCGGNGTIDLSQGGPKFNGSDFGVWGAPSDHPKNFSGASWVSPAAPIPDPFASLPAPTMPAQVTTYPCTVPGGCGGGYTGYGYEYVAHGMDGCPDSKGCDEYHPGLYTAPVLLRPGTSIFIPGLYYFKPTTYTVANGGKSGTYLGNPGSGCSPGASGQGNADLVLGQNTLVRPSTQAGDGSSGVTFYFSGNPGPPAAYGSIFLDANSGKVPSSHVVDDFVTANAACLGASIPPEIEMPATLNGNVLLGPCTSKGTYIGAPHESIGPGRGILFFDDRANGDQRGQPNMQGGPQMLLSGTMYFHNCPGSPTCNSGDYQAFFDIQGSGGSGTYILGEIVTDQLVQGGTGSIKMQLSPYAILTTLKAALVQ